MVVPKEALKFSTTSRRFQNYGPNARVAFQQTHAEARIKYNHPYKFCTGKCTLNSPKGNSCTNKDGTACFDGGYVNEFYAENAKDVRKTLSSVLEIFGGISPLFSRICCI